MDYKFNIWCRYSVRLFGEKLGYFFQIVINFGLQVDIIQFIDIINGAEKKAYAFKVHAEL